MGKDYLLLDGARFEQFPKLLKQLDSTLAPYPLYGTTPYAPVADLGPWLIEAAPSGLLARTFQAEWREHGIWLHSEAPQPALLDHLRSLVHLHLKGAGTVLSVSMTR